MAARAHAAAYFERASHSDRRRTSPKLAPEGEGSKVASVELRAGRLGDLDPIAFSELIADVERAAI
jgi:hypothetical protein